MDKNKQVVSLNVFNALKSKYLSLNKKTNMLSLGFKKSRSAFKRLLRDYVILKKKYLIMRKYSTKKVNELIEKINRENYQIVLDHNRKLLKISQEFLSEIEMDNAEFAQSFYIDILFEKFLPQIDSSVNVADIEPFKFPIMIKNYQFEEEHIHPYLYFNISGKIKYDSKNKRYL